MNNRLRKVLSVLIAVLMIAVLLPTASLAGTSVHVYYIPNFVEDVIVNLTGGKTINCDINGSKWAGSDNGDYVTNDIVSVTLKWGTNTEIIQSSNLTIGTEGGGSGTLKIDLLSSWNTTSVNVTKIWDDNNDQDGKRPDSINITLLGGGNSTTESVTGTGNTWTHQFTGLKKYNENDGTLITYTADEPTVPAGYSKSVNGLDVTNTHTPETTSVLVTKIWVDSNNQDKKRPESINVKLYDGGREVTSQAIGSSGWTYEFTGLDKYRDGSLIVYTIDEDPVDGYEKKVEGYNITNTYTPPVTPKGILRLTKSVSGTTADDTFEFTVDGPNAYHTNVTLHGSAFMDITDLTPGDYTVTEINIPSGYTLDGVNPKTISVAAGTTPSPITFINTYTPQKGSLTVTKVVAGTAAPTTPAVYSFSVTGPNGYTNSFTITGESSHPLTGLEPGSYTVTEDVPAGSAFAVDDAHQTKTVDANQTAQLTFTNTYTPADPKTGTLIIRKHVEGEGAPAGDEFDFNIQRVQSVEQISVMAFTPFSLEDGEERTYTDLTPGEYLITETHWPDGYEPESESQTVTVEAGKSKTVTFVNVYENDKPNPPAQTYTVSYHPNGGLGNVPVDMNRYYPGDKAWLKSGAGLYRLNYVFAGWSLIDGTRVNDPYIMGRSDVTFFAIWVPVNVPKTGDQATSYGLMMLLGAVSLAALNLLRKRKHS